MADRRLRLNMHVPVLLVTAAAKWVIYDTLMLRLEPTWSATQYLPIVNPVAGTGALIAASAIAMRWLLRPIPNPSAPDRQRDWSLLLWSLAVFLIAWAGSAEIDRAVQLAAVRTGLVWGTWQLEQLAWTIWWSAIAAASLIVLTRIADEPLVGRRQVMNLVSALIVLLAGKFLFVDTLLFRVLTGSPPGVTVMLNVQTAAAAVVCSALLIARRFGVEQKNTQSVAPVMIALVLLWAGTLEIDRAMEQPGVIAMLAQPGLAKQVALSIFWSLFAIASVVIGFPLRMERLRYLGLGLFAVTLLKVVAIDMSSVSTGYRILSFIGLGGLMLGTSVLYGKLSPALLSANAGARETTDMAA